MRAWVAAAGIVLVAATGWAQSGSTGLPDRYISANVGSGGSATIVIESRESVSATVSGTWAGTLTPEASATPNCENTNYGTAAWTAVSLYSSAGVRSATTAANGAFLLTPVAGHRCVRLRMSAYTSGTAVVALRTGVAPPVDLGGTVSVNEPVSVDDNGGSLTVDNATLSVVGGGVEATAQRVTIASDSTGVVSVDDNAASLTVDAPAAAPVAIGFTDGAAMLTTSNPDMDTGAGEAYRAALGIMAAASGGPVALEGTTANGLEVDVTRIATGTSNIGDVDVEILGTACTPDTENTGLVADTTLEAATANMRLKCWTAVETAGAAAYGILRHGVVGAGVCAGTPFAYVKLAPNESAGDCFEAQGQAAASGVCLDWVSGTISANICTATEGAP